MFTYSLGIDLVQRVKDDMARLSEALHAEPNSLDELKAVLNTVATIKAATMSMELQYSDLEERFRYDLREGLDLGRSLLYVFILVSLLMKIT